MNRWLLLLPPLAAAICSSAAASQDGGIGPRKQAFVSAKGSKRCTARSGRG